MPLLIGLAMVSNPNAESGASSHRSGEVGLKREVGWFGSFAMGYGDVGADIFIALGIVTLYAGGAAPLAFLIASLVYLTIGLAYMELAPTYPYAGGSQAYAMRASNSFVSFLAGWSLMLSYILCISLFSVAAAGYLKFLIPALAELSVDFPLLGFRLPDIGIIGGLLVLLLVTLNYVGIRYSANFLSVLVLVGLAIQGTILALGFSLAFDQERLLTQILTLGSDLTYPNVGYLPWLDVSTNNFLYGLTLAMASFIGIESIAQAAEETKKPHRCIPRATKLSIVTVLLSVILFSVLSVGVLDWRVLGNSYENPVARIVLSYPSVGDALAPVVAFAAFILCYASSNTGVIGASRLAASMGRLGLLPKWLYRIHPKYRTPSRTIILFGGIGLGVAIVGDIPFIASIYNFGALLSYMLLMLSLLLLRSRDAGVYRPWKIPISIKLNKSYGKLELPISGILGLVGTTALWVLVVLLHPMGRIFGLSWTGIGIALYLASRRLTRRRIISREEARLVAPLAYRMDVTVLVRPFEDLDVVRRTIERSLDPRFRIRLVSVLEPIRLGLDKKEGLGRIRGLVEADLADLARQLSSEGYEVAYHVHVGDFSEALEKELQSGRADMIAYIKRSTEKATIEKGHESKVHVAMNKYPGRVMVLKRAV